MDPLRLLPPFIAVAAALLVFAVLVIVTWRFPESERRFELELIRESEVAELEPMPESESSPEETDIEASAEVEVKVELENSETVPSVGEIALSSPTIAVSAPRPLPEAQAVMRIQSPVQLKSLAGGARSAGGRTDALRRFGGNAEVEGAVLRGLRWLKRRQLEDGSWRAKGEGDATAFALLAFLAHGESFTSAEFGPTVKAAVNYLREHHGNNLAVYALTEAAAVIRTPVLGEAAAAALREFCQRQKSRVKANTGGIIQKYAAVMTLVAARMARLEIPETAAVDATYTRAFLEMRDGKGPDFKRIRGSGTWHFMVGGVCLQYLRHGGDEATQRMLRRLDELWVPATLGKTAIACCPVRSNYFATMIFFNAGGALWEKWNQGMIAAYVPTQVREGDGGYWRCQDEHIGDQPFWTTCYIVHQLMVYYRYLPTYSESAWSADESKPSGEWHDPRAVVVEVDI